MEKKILVGPAELKREFPFLSDWLIAKLRKERRIRYTPVGHRTFLYDVENVRAALAKLEIQEIA